MLGAESALDYFGLEELARLDFNSFSANSDQITKILRSLYFSPLVYEKSLEQRLHTWLVPIDDHNTISILGTQLNISYNYNINLNEFMIFKELNNLQIPNIRHFYFYTPDFIDLSPSLISLTEKINEYITLSDYINGNPRTKTLISIIFQLVCSLRMIYDKIENYVHGIIDPDSICLVKTPKGWIKYTINNENVYVFVNQYRVVMSRNIGCSGRIVVNGRSFEIVNSVRKQTEIVNPLVTLNTIISKFNKLKDLLIGTNPINALSILLTRVPSPSSYFADSPDNRDVINMENINTGITGFIAGKSEKSEYDFFRLAYTGNTLSNTPDNPYYITLLNEYMKKLNIYLAEDCDNFNSVKSEKNYVAVLLSFYDIKNLLAYIESISEDDENITAISSLKTLIDKNWPKMFKYVDTFINEKKLYNKVNKL